MSKKEKIIQKYRDPAPCGCYCHAPEKGEKKQKFSLSFFNKPKMPKFSSLSNKTKGNLGIAGLVLPMLVGVVALWIYARAFFWLIAGATGVFFGAWLIILWGFKMITLINNREN